MAKKCDMCNSFYSARCGQCNNTGWVLSSEEKAALSVTVQIDEHQFNEIREKATIDTLVLLLGYIDKCDDVDDVKALIQMTISNLREDTKDDN